MNKDSLIDKLLKENIELRARLMEEVAALAYKTLDTDVLIDGKSPLNSVVFFYFVDWSMMIRQQTPFNRPCPICKNETGHHAKCIMPQWVDRVN